MNSMHPKNSDKLYSINSLAGTFAALLMLCNVVVAQETDGSAAGESAPDLDQQLLDDLGDDLLEGLDDIPLDPALNENDGNGGAADRQLQDALGEGEDIGAAGEDELTRIARLMRQAQSRIEEQKVSQDTQDLQDDIVAQLEELIKQLQQCKKQCSSTGANKPSTGSKPLEQPNQPDAGQQQTSNKPARDSEERLGFGKGLATQGTNPWR